MGTTPVYALPYPEATDPADVPLDMRELAERIEQATKTLYHEILTDEARTAAGFGDLATVGPQVTIPFTGRWTLIMSVNAYVTASAPNVVIQVGLSLAGAAPQAADQMSAVPATNSAGIPMVRAIVRTLNAGTVAKVQYATLGGLTGKFRERSLVVMPAGPT